MNILGKNLAPNGLFSGEKAPYKVQPFKPWENQTTYTKSYYGKQENNLIKLDWWNAYQNVKHNRIENRTQAKLEVAVNSLAALFLVILQDKACEDAIAQAGWLSYPKIICGDHQKPHDFLSEDFEQCPAAWITAETKHFSYPVGWCGRPIKVISGLPITVWRGNSSHRFIEWFNEHYNI
jgi:hypothetical protein